MSGNGKTYLLVAVVLFAGAIQQVHAFEFYRFLYPGKNTELIYRFDLIGTTPLGRNGNYNASFDFSLDNWRPYLPIKLVIKLDGEKPCLQIPGEVSVFFVSQSDCNLELGGALARGAPGWPDPWGAERRSGVIYFNSDINWSTPEEGFDHLDAMNFHNVATHEIGHSLMLGHSHFRSSVMSIRGTGFAKTNNELSIDDICAISIVFGNAGNCPLLLGSQTVSGKRTGAIFVGGASSDEGITFKEEFDSLEAITAVATVVIDPKHIRFPLKYFAVAKLSDGAIFVLDPKIGFELISNISEVSGRGQVRDGFPMAAEELVLLENYVPASYGISEIEIEFWFGYSLNSNPQEYYYNNTPIRININ